MIVKDTNTNTTYYLALFLIADIIIAGILLCFFRQKEWWNNWMVMAPNLFMILGALYCPMMKKNIGGKMTWMLVYKGIKLALAAIMVVLYIFLVKENAKAFVLITAICYLVGLIIETYSVVDYTKKILRKQ